MGAFDNLLSGTDGGTGNPAIDAYAPGRNLTPAQLDYILGLRTSGFRSSGSGDGANTQWFNPNITGNNDWRLNQQEAGRWVGGDAGWWEAIPDLDQHYITRVRPDTGGKLGDRWGLDGSYLGVFEAGDGGGRDFNTAVAMMAAGYFGGGALGEAAQGAGYGTAAAAADLGTGGSIGLSGAGSGAGAASAGAGAGAGASTLTDKAVLYGNTGYGAGMTGAQTAAYDAALASGATAGSGGLTWQSVVDGAGKMLGNVDLSQLGTLALASGLSKDVDDPRVDPNLQTSIDGLKDVYNAANDRAKSNDEYFQSTFAPRYLQAMDDQLAMSRQLSDFQMGLAKRYDQRYWDTTAKQQDAFYSAVDAYDTDAARARLVGEAGANADMQNAAALQALKRDMDRRGLNPNSGLVMSNMRQQAQTGALQKTMAMNMAREAARKEGLNMRAVAAGLGGSLTGATAQFAGGAGNASTLGMNGIQGAQGGFNANNASWLNNMNLGTNALGTLGNYGMNLTNMGFNANMLNTQGWNQMLGYGLGMFGGRRNTGTGG